MMQVFLTSGCPGYGIEVCREMRRRGVIAPIMMLTARTLEQRVEGLDAGADDYLTKPFVLAELLARVRALIRRVVLKGYAPLRYADLELDRRQQRAKRGTETISLTSKEFALLELFLLHAGEWITRSEILEHVWEHHSDTGSNLVDVYINRVRNKIDQNGFTKLIHTVRGVGYQLGLPEKKEEEVDNSNHEDSFRRAINMRHTEWILLRWSLRDSAN